MIKSARFNRRPEQSGIEMIQKWQKLHSIGDSQIVSIGTGLTLWGANCSGKGYNDAVFFVLYKEERKTYETLQM